MPEITIYKLQCKNNLITDFYIGSTKNIIGRMSFHKHKSQNDVSKKLYRAIRNNGGFDNWECVILYTFDDLDNQRFIKEREYIDNLKPSLNSSIPSRPRHEWVQLKKMCPHCNKSYRIDNITHHIKTNKHINNVKEILYDI
jgi:hypothetical protein